MTQINKVINFLNANCINHQIYFKRGICGDVMSEVYNQDDVRILRSERLGMCYTQMPTKEMQLWNELAAALKIAPEIPDDCKYYEIFGLSSEDKRYIEAHLGKMSVLKQPIPLKVKYDVQ